MTATALDAPTRLAALLADDLAALEALIVDRIRPDEHPIPELGRHIMTPGKRLRAMIALTAARLCDDTPEARQRAVSLAAAVELMHTATLLHDDVVDASERRRGLPAARAIWGDAASVLTGDLLLGRAFELMVEPGSLEALRILARAAAIIARGEVAQLVHLGRADVDEKAILAVLADKTAALFDAAARAGAVAAGANAQTAQALGAYGHNLGLAFQVADDALDYDGDARALGKNVGDDFREGKPTLPMAYAYAQADAQGRAFWEQAFAAPAQADFDQALALIARHDALARARACAKDFSQRAQNALASAPDIQSASNSTLLATLKDLAAFCASRSA